jgi:hypothetical protein
MQMCDALLRHLACISDVLLVACCGFLVKGQSASHLFNSNRGQFPLETNQHSSTTLREILVLRLWRSSQRENWVGEVQNVQTGQIKYVNSPEQLFNIILELMGPGDEPAR